MKIEIGESLFYSWLRHVKNCELVHLNWSTSPEWDYKADKEQLNKIVKETEVFFKEEYGTIYGKWNEFDKIYKKVESDLVGFNFSENKIYAVEVAFHENGLGYKDNCSKVISKFLRIALSIYASFGTQNAEIIFASPKIRGKDYSILQKDIKSAQQLLNQNGINYTFTLIANESFNLELIALLDKTKQVSDTTELFLRSYKLINMFENSGENKLSVENQLVTEETALEEYYTEQKIGKLVRSSLVQLLESNKVSAAEIEQLQTKAYSKEIFNLNFPLLVKLDGEYDKVRYYRDPIVINNVEYVLCSQWFNKDRELLINWIKERL